MAPNGLPVRSDQLSEPAGPLRRAAAAAAGHQEITAAAHGTPRLSGCAAVSAVCRAG